MKLRLAQRLSVFLCVCPPNCLAVSDGDESYLGGQVVTSFAARLDARDHPYLICIAFNACPSFSVRCLASHCIRSVLLLLLVHCHCPASALVRCLLLLLVSCPCGLPPSLLHCFFLAFPARAMKNLRVHVSTAVGSTQRVVPAGRCSSQRTRSLAGFERACRRESSWIQTHGA